MTMEHDLRQAALLADRLSAALVNLPCRGPKLPLTAREQTAYSYGHRDARHAAAELVGPALSAIEAVQGDSVHLASFPSDGVSGSDVPARPTSPAEDAPIDMLLFCPACGLQHVDAPEASDVFRASMMRAAGVTENAPRAWTNPPHKSHLCHRCGHVWRPADVPTNGVLETKTRGANDSFTSMLGTPKTAASFDEFFDREYPNVEDRQGKFRNSNGYQLCWRGWEAATERAAAICRGVNNHDNPMTANDCADEIEKGLEP